MYKIIANEELFNKWVKLSERVKLVSTVVQNDITLDKECISELMEDSRQLSIELESLFDETIEYVLSCKIE